MNETKEKLVFDDIDEDLDFDNTLEEEKKRKRNRIIILIILFFFIAATTFAGVTLSRNMKKKPIEKPETTQSSNWKDEDVYPITDSEETKYPDKELPGITLN